MLLEGFLPRQTIRCQSTDLGCSNQYVSPSSDPRGVGQSGSLGSYHSSKVGSYNTTGQKSWEK